MPKISSRFVLACVVAIGCNLSNAGDQPSNALVDDFINNGAYHVIDKCSGKSWPRKCPHGEFLRSEKDFSLQKFWYEGMEIGFREKDISYLSIYRRKWPAYRGLGIGTAREEILALLGEPINHERDQPELIYCTAVVEDCVRFELGADQRVSKIMWSYFFD